MIRAGSARRARCTALPWPCDHWGVWARALFWGCWLMGGLLASDSAISIADFDGAQPFAGWALSKDSRIPGADGSLTLGPGHAGHGALLDYRFACSRGNCGAVAALWTPGKPLALKHRAALSFWIRSNSEVKLTLLIEDKSEGTRRYPFEVTTLEHSEGSDWRQVVVPLAAQSTGYGDEDHNGAPRGRATSLGILVEPRYPLPVRGSLGFDDVQLLESPDGVLMLNPTMPLTAPPPGSAQLRPRLGVNIHDISDTRMPDLARDTGFSFVRVDLLWRDVEANGAYRLRAYDRLLASLESHGLGALWILDYGHPQHGGDTPRSQEDVAAFARFAGVVANHFRGRNVRYEIWNEPNTERFWRPQPNATEYAALFVDAAASIHRSDPEARVATGGLARIDLPFLQQMFAAGANGENAVGVHPYRKSGPESLAAELPLLRHALAPSGSQDVGIWDTEWGYASYDYFSQNLHGDGHSGPGRKRQAVLACREALTVWALGLPVAVWYDLRDDGVEARNPEHNYGLLDRDNGDKPAMKALRTLTQIAVDHTFAGMVQDVPDGTHAMRLDGSADKIFVVWSDQPDARIVLQFPAEGLISATNLMGEPLKSKIVLVEADGPVYLKFTFR